MVRFRLIFAKVMFFATALCNVGWTRFQNNALIERGITVRDVGILKGIGLLFKIFGEIFCCVIADRHDPVMVFIFCALVQAYSLECIRSSTTLTFNYVLYIKFLRGLTACLPTLTNALICSLTAGTKEGYGQQRLFGSLAWGLGALFIGILIDAYGTNAIFFFAYTFHFISALCMYVGTKYVVGTTYNQKGLDHFTAEVGQEANSVSIWVSGAIVAVSKLVRQTNDSFQQLLRHDALKFILYDIFVYGTVMTIIDSIMTTSLMTDYSTSASFGGMYTGMGVVSCIPAFYVSTQVIEMYGHYHVFLFAQITCVVRLLINAMLDIHWEHSPSVLLCTQLLHGICFALYWSTAVDIMYKLAPPDMKNTSLGVLNSLYFTIGGAAGNILWSYTYQRYGINYTCLYGGFFLMFNIGVLHVLFSNVIIKQIEIVEHMHQHNLKSQGMKTSTPNHHSNGATHATSFGSTKVGKGSTNDLAENDAHIV